MAFPAFLAGPISQRTAGKRGSDFLFTSWQGLPLRNNNFRDRVFDPTLEALRAQHPSFPIVTLHDPRHTAASLAVSAGANVKAVQRMLGHAPAAMTLDVYADLFDEDLSSVSDALDREAAVRFCAHEWSEGNHPALT